jgi:hypothetical protein
VPVPSVDWSAPLSHSIEISDPDEAELSFDPVVPPSDIGNLAKILTSDPSFAPLEKRSIMWVYDGERGPFDILEAPTTSSDNDLVLMATCQPDETGCSTEGWSQVTLADGVVALLIDGGRARAAAATSVSWIANGVLFDIEGPPETFSVQEAESVASAL